MQEMVKSKRDGNSVPAARNSLVYQGCYYVAYTFRSIDLSLQYVFFFCVCVLSLALSFMLWAFSSQAKFCQACLAGSTQLYAESLQQSELKAVCISQKGHKTPHRTLGDSQTCMPTRALRDIAVLLVAMTAASLVNMNFLYT